MLVTYLFTIVLSSAGAVTLAPIPQGPKDPLPIQVGSENYPCDQVALKLADYSTIARSQHEGITSFLNQVSERVRGWYAELSPLEEKTQTLEAGTFQPLDDGASEISSVTDAAYDNYDHLQNELDRILASLQACTVAQKQALTK